MRQIKILIVEDEVLIAEHIKAYLLGFGFDQIYMAHTKHIGLSLIDQIQPNLVLLDLHLQKPKDGLEIANFIDQRGGPPYILLLQMQIY